MKKSNSKKQNDRARTRHSRRQDAGMHGNHGTQGQGRRSAGAASAERSEYSADQAAGSSEVIFGRNPILEALKSGKTIEKIFIAEGTEGSVKKIAAQAAERRIPVQYVSRPVIDRMMAESAELTGAEHDGASHDGASLPHQGVAAYVSAFVYSSLDELIKTSEDSGEPPFFIILDGIEDPHNLGAVMRTAECCGAHGLIIPSRRAATVNATAAKSAAGAENYIKVAKVANIGKAIDELKERGLWIAACDMDGSSYYEADLTGSIALVIGNEGKGISRLVKEKCDFTVSIPMLGHINSLNASNAASILMYEVRRQRSGIR